MNSFSNSALQVLVPRGSFMHTSYAVSQASLRMKGLLPHSNNNLKDSDASGIPLTMKGF